MSSVPNAGPISLSDLPPELIAQVASNTDDSALKALAATSRSLRAKSLHIYGDRFFRTLKFCMYSISLEALLDISCTPHLTKFVKHVAFGTENGGLLSPGRDSDFQPSKMQYTPKMLSAVNKNDLIAMRIRTDAAVISRALMQFPNLALLIVGRRFSLDGKDIRRSCGVSLFDKPSTMSAYYRSTGTTGPKQFFVVYCTVALAVQQMGPQSGDIKLGISLDGTDGVQMQQNRRLVPWGSSDSVTQRVSSLQLQLFADDQSFSGMGIAALADTAAIKSLEVQYNHQRTPEHHIHLISLRLTHLQRIVLKGLWATTTAFIQFFQNSDSQLTHISLIECSLAKRKLIPPFRVYPGLPSPGPPDTQLDESERCWLGVIRELQHLEELVFLHLERLEKDEESYHNDTTPHDRMDSEMSLAAIWKGKVEINKGLTQLANQVDYLTFHDSRSRPSPTEHYLNLRFANFEASTAYSWTTEEARAISNYRHCYVNSRKQHLSTVPFDDDIEFPIHGHHPLGYYDQGRLPNGHQLLGGILWDKWQVVWVSNAPKSSGNW